MELSFFNLKYNPFVRTLPPDRLFRSRSYLRGMQAIAYGIEGRKSLIALLAPRGMGKTTLMHAYLEQRLQRNLQTIWLSGQSSTFATILDRVCTQCDVPADEKLETTLRGLRAALKRAAHSGRRLVLLIDEAESLSAKTLADLLVLAGMRDESIKLLTVILIGEPVLEPHLKRACSQSFRVEGYHRIRLEPLQRQESMAYVQHRIAHAAMDKEARFTPGALRRVARYVRGNPGLLNYVCNEALRAAVMAQQKPITKPIVRAVLNDLEGRQPRLLWRWGVAALVGGLVIAGISMGSPHLAPMVTELVAKVKPEWLGAERSELEEKLTEPSAMDPPIPLSSPLKTAPSSEAILKDTPQGSEAPSAAATPRDEASAAPETPSPEARETPPPEPDTNLIAHASLLCLTARPPGNRARDIIIVDYHGKVQQRLVSDGALNLSPIMSPDQRHLAYTSYREGTPSIYLRDLENDKDERLTSRSGIALPGAWSPDGRYLALSKSEDGNSDIFLYDLQRRHMRRLTSHNGIDISPSFAPDSKRLVFTSSRSGTSQIYLTDVNGRPPTRLTQDGPYNTAPVWSPRGDWIAFIGRAPERTLELYVIRDDGTRLRRMTRGGSTVEDAPTWSPDGQAILYTRVRDGIRERRIIDMYGQNDRSLPGHGQVCYSPQWMTQLTH